LFSPAICGIDIEGVGRKIDLSAILKRYFSETERQSWQSHRQNDETLCFFRGWTRKEAFLKATGEGISGLGKCEISFAPDIKKALLNSEKETKETKNWFFNEFLPEENFIGSIVIKGRDLPIQRLNLEKKISEFLA
jgi:4'-phosphopantetheinyl transferase